jgi:hypothetical protein
MIEILFLPIQPFIWHPERIAFVAGLFLASFVGLLLVCKTPRRYNPWPLLIPTAIWAAYAPWEAYCMAGKYNIRVDLLIIYPIILAATVLGVAGAVKKRRKPLNNKTCRTDSPRNGGSNLIP